MPPYAPIPTTLPLKNGRSYKWRLLDSSASSLHQKPANSPWAGSCSPHRTRGFHLAEHVLCESPTFHRSMTSLLYLPHRIDLGHDTFWSKTSTVSLKMFYNPTFSCLVPFSISQSRSFSWVPYSQIPLPSGQENEKLNYFLPKSSSPSFIFHLNYRFLTWSNQSPGVIPNFPISFIYLVNHYVLIFLIAKISWICIVLYTIAAMTWDKTSTHAFLLLFFLTPGLSYFSPFFLL